MYSQCNKISHYYSCRKIHDEYFKKVIHDYKVADKNLEHFLFYDFIYEAQVLEDNQIEISIALETGCTLVLSEFFKLSFSNINGQNDFIRADKILEHFYYFINYSLLNSYSWFFYMSFIYHSMQNWIGYILVKSTFWILLVLIN